MSASSLGLDESVDSLRKSGTSRMSGANRFVISLVVLFAFTTVVLVVALAVTTTNKENQVDEVCTTEGCVLASARVIGAMDTSVNPCDDFYKFSCGAWIRKHPNLKDKNFSVFGKLHDDLKITLKEVLEADNLADDAESVKKARMFYASCMNESNIEDLGLGYIRQYTEAFGGWQVLGNNASGKWNARSYNFENLLVHAKRGVNKPPLIDFGVSQDYTDSKHYILYVDQPDLGMHSRNDYLKSRDDPTLMAYQKRIQDFAIAMGADWTTAANDARTMVDFEVEIAKIMVPEEGRRATDNLYNKVTIADMKKRIAETLVPEEKRRVRRDIGIYHNKMTIADMKKRFAGIDWSSLLKNMMAIVGTTITDTEPVKVISHDLSNDYFNKLGGILGRYTYRTVANYIIFRIVSRVAEFLPKELREDMSVTPKGIPRWQTCSNIVTSTLSEVVGRMYLINALKKESTADLLDMVERVRGSFKDMVDALPWMGDATKSIAKEKADAIDPRIGFPEIVYNAAALDDKFKEVTITANDPLRSLVSVGEAGVKDHLGKLRKTHDKSQWDMPWTTVNAFYDPTTIQIIFPAGILQLPFYSTDQPAYLNYGGIGYVIGHEITHGFDDQERQYDKNGNQTNWWSKEDADEFEAMDKCIIDQYSNFTVPGTGGVHLNGTRTLSENIADNGGIKESFKAYRKWVAARGSEEPKLPGIDYTPSQLYFLNLAQLWCNSMTEEDMIEMTRTASHTVDKFRVLGSMQNFDEFSKAWSCPPGSFMNKVNKCAVW